MAHWMSFTALRGQWDDDFVVVEPGEKVTFEHFGFALRIRDADDLLNPEERLQTAISLGKPDRIPLCPTDRDYGRRAGLTNYEFMYDYKKAEWAFNQLHRQYPLGM